MCLVLFVLDLFPFASRQILLVLSCCTTDGFAPSLLMIGLIDKFTTCCSINNLTLITKFIASSTPMISATVELVKLTFYLFDGENTAPLPNVSIAAVWLLMSLWTANDASMLHSNVLESSHSITRGRCIVSWRYCITLASFKQSSLVGSPTLVHKYAITPYISGRACFVANNNLVIILWK